MIEPKYASFSDESNALDYLEKTVEFIHRAETNPTEWKWVILSIHGALYGFMICALKGTDRDRVVVSNNKGERRLISFRRALKWCQDPAYMNMTTESQVLQLSADQQRSLDLIQEYFRNSFAHYEPRLWSIEIHGMPDIIIDGVTVARFLSLETGNYTHLTIEAGARIRALAEEGIESLRRTRLFRELHSE